MVRLSVRPWNSTVEEFDGRIPREAARVEVPWWMKNLRPLGEGPCGHETNFMEFMRNILSVSI